MQKEDFQAWVRVSVALDFSVPVPGRLPVPHHRCPRADAEQGEGGPRLVDDGGADEKVE